MGTKNQQIQDLTELNEALENYFRNTIIPQLFIDANLILRKFTPAAMKQFKLFSEDVGKSFKEVISNLRFPSITENIQHVIDTNDILEKEIQTNDLKWYQMNIIPYVQKKDNKANGVVITFVDITLRIKDLQEQERLLADHETLLDSISHDIKNPLNNLLLTVQILDSPGYDDSIQIQALLQTIKNGVKKLHKVIDSLTEIRNSPHKYKTVDELLNLENIIEDVRFILLDNIEKSGTIVKCEMNISEVLFSRRNLRSIVYNLINNAIKFRSPERQPEIIITTTKENDFIILSIKDNGIGIEPSKHEDIFSKHFRVDNQIEGSGVGLHIVKSLVENAGGKILVESEVGKGTEFKVCLKAD